MLKKYATALTVLLALVANPAYSGEPPTEAETFFYSIKLQWFRLAILHLNDQDLKPGELVTKVAETRQTLESFLLETKPKEPEEKEPEEESNDFFEGFGATLRSLFPEQLEEDEIIDFLDVRTVVREVAFKARLFEVGAYTKDELDRAVRSVVGDYLAYYKSLRKPWYEQGEGFAAYKNIELYQLIHRREKAAYGHLIARTNNGSERGRN